MSIPLPSPVTSTKRSMDHITAVELQAFMNKHGISNKELGEILGVTFQAVRLWLVGDRTISVTVSRVITMFDKYPQLIRDF